MDMEFQSFAGRLGGAPECLAWNRILHERILNVYVFTAAEDNQRSKLSITRPSAR
jgi:hypothetical protein